VLWAVTSLNGHVPTELMAAASRECLTRDLASFGSVNLNMLVWACARCRHMSPELAVAVNRAVLQLLPTFSVHNLSRVLGALAGLQCLQPAVLEAAEPGLMQRLEAGRIHVQVGGSVSRLCHSAVLCACIAVDSLAFSGDAYVVTRCA
jgi:hypothetical protein